MILLLLDVMSGHSQSRHFWVGSAANQRVWIGSFRDAGHYESLSSRDNASIVVDYGRFLPNPFNLSFSCHPLFSAINCS
jgi:hypothetical protein